MERKIQICRMLTGKIWRLLLKYLFPRLMLIYWRKHWTKVCCNCNNVFFPIDFYIYYIFYFFFFLIAFKALRTNTIESLVIAYKTDESPEDTLLSLKQIWSVVEKYVKADKLFSVGLSDINTNTFTDLFHWAEVRMNHLLCEVMCVNPIQCVELM